jgi:S-formylglutathione hydrolase FrmB
MQRICSIAVFIFLSVFSQAQSLKFVVHLDTAVHQTVSGRLYIFSQTDTSQKVGEPDPFGPTPAFYIDVQNWKQDEVKVIDSTAQAFPVKMNELKPGFYRFGSLLDINTEERNLKSAGNLFNRKDIITQVAKDNNGEVHIYLNGVFKGRQFNGNDSVQQLNYKSALLSAFRKKDIFLKAAVVLPHNYTTDVTKEYPVVFIIPGWGGTHYDATSPFPAQRYGFNMGKEKIFVYLDPDTQTPFGLHAFVDSRVNGPWGKALVEEVIPALEKKYRIRKDPSQRFVMGQSTGGYGALWLQLNYPRAFGGCWAVSPDPVDFSDFLSLNIYDPNKNAFYDDSNHLRPFFLWDGKFVSTIKAFCDFETFMGDGGQMQSFEAEFGKPGKDGRPLLIYDRKTGRIDPEIAASWKPYDMGLYIKQNWKKLAKDLEGKVHIYAGAEDNFYLDGAVMRLKEKATKANAAIVAELIPHANHFSIWSPAFTQRVQGEIDQLVKD